MLRLAGQPLPGALPGPGAPGGRGAQAVPALRWPLPAGGAQVRGHGARLGAGEGGLGGLGLASLPEAPRWDFCGQR